MAPPQTGESGPAPNLAFMTLAMRLAWLLREDIRAGAPLDDEAGQRNFVVWWLLYGYAEYPAAWWYGPVQEAVAMAPSGTVRNAALPRLLQHLHGSRADLAEAFQLADAENVAKFYCWYRLFGPREMWVTPTLPEAARKATEVPVLSPPGAADPTALPRLALMMHESSAELQETFDITDAAGRQGLADWYAAIGHLTIPAPRVAPCRAEILPRRPVSSGRRPLCGVNLVGFARGELGLGEDVRMMSAALEAVGIDHLIIDVASGSKARLNDNSVAHRVKEHLRYDITVFCLTAFDTARLYLERGPDLFAADTNIGNWAWELSRFPASWAAAYALVDELWAASAFSHAAFVATSPKPVHMLPPAIQIPALPSLQRRAFGLPARPVFIFIYPFDPNSYLARKNPCAAVLGFREAFPLSDRSVALVLRVNGHIDRDPQWTQVQAALAQDDRILVIDGTLDRAMALALLACCDCLVSPHRAEGFGRNIAEALLLGIPVLATGYSGCMDFLAPEETIAWSQVALAPNDYPCGEGTWWAEPSITDLAAKMRRRRETGASDRASAAAARRIGRMTARYDPAAAGARYAARLGEHRSKPE